MYAKHVQRIVCTQHFLQTIDTPQTSKARQEADDQSATDAHIAASGSDGHQAGHGARSSAEHRSFAAHHRFADAPPQNSSSGGTKGVDKGQGSKTIGFQRRTGIETKPAHPQQRGAYHGQSQAVRGHGFFAIADALADHVGTHQTGHRGVDVDHRTAGKVQRAHLPQEASFGVHCFYYLFAGVSVRAHPEPHHMGNRCVAEGEPQGAE